MALETLSWISWSLGAIVVALFQITLSNPYVLVSLFTACAQGHIDIVDELIPVEDSVRPEPRALAVYSQLLPVFAELYTHLVPTFQSLRRLAPNLPLDLLDED